MANFTHIFEDFFDVSEVTPPVTPFDFFNNEEVDPRYAPSDWSEGWAPGMPNPIVPFRHQPTFVVEFQFNVSTLPEHINDPEPYLPGQVHGLQHWAMDRSLNDALQTACQQNGITNTTIDFGATETAWRSQEPAHVLCQGLPAGIIPSDASFQSPIGPSGDGYAVTTEPWIPLWQIDAKKAFEMPWKPMNLQRYDVFPMRVVSPVLPLTEESFKEVDRFAQTILHTFRVQKEFGPGIKARCESRTDFRWPGTEYPESLKDMLEARFSLVPQENQEIKFASTLR